jgi:hypothetical protein
MDRIKIIIMGLFLILGMLGCGKLKDNHKSFAVSNSVPETEEFYNEFMAFAESETIDNLGSKVSMNIYMDDSLNSKTYAKCERNESEDVGNYIQVEKIYKMNIKINPTLWETINKNTKRLVIYHELGHCILKRDHDDSKIRSSDGTIDKSIMNTYTSGSSIFIKYKKYYISELFNANIQFNDVPDTIASQKIDQNEISQIEDSESQEDGPPDQSIIID